MNFSEALHQIKYGAFMAREGWNGKNMAVFFVPGSEFTVETGRPMAAALPPGTKVRYRPHLDMLAADGTVGVWLASQSDILADDWVAVHAPPVVGVTGQVTPKE